MDDIKEISYSFTCLQRVEALSPQSKLVVCSKAMGLLDIAEVESKVKSWISEMNGKAGANKPFKGHRGVPTTKLVDRVAQWCIDNKFVIIRDPPPVRDDGVQRLFPENVVKA